MRDFWGSMVWAEKVVFTVAGLLLLIVVGDAGYMIYLMATE